MKLRKKHFWFLNSFCVIIGLVLSNCSSTNKTISKSLIGVWQSEDDPSTYHVYLEKDLYVLSTNSDKSISIIEYKYGFSDEMIIESLNELKKVGAYYYEVSIEDFDNSNKRESGGFYGVNPYSLDFTKNKKSFTYYNIQIPGQVASYKRVEKLPDNLNQYLVNLYPALE